MSQEAGSSPARPMRRLSERNSPRADRPGGATRAVRPRSRVRPRRAPWCSGPGPGSARDGVPRHPTRRSARRAPRRGAFCMRLWCEAMRTRLTPSRYVVTVSRSTSPKPARRCSSASPAKVPVAARPECPTPAYAPTDSASAVEVAAKLGHSRVRRATRTDRHLPVPAHGFGSTSLSTPRGSRSLRP
jgi:hypothetical protein